jgi:surfeit locus 1 family protein
LRSQEEKPLEYSAARGHRWGTLRMKIRPKGGLSLFVAVFLPLVLGLAAWQDRRAEDKAALEARMAAQATQAPRAVETWLADSEALWPFAPAFARGRWRADRALWLDNQTDQGRVGYGLYVPLVLEDGTWLLVDLGFRRAPERRDALPPLTLPAGPVAVSGHLRPAPPVRPVLGDEAVAEGWPRRVQALRWRELQAAFGTQNALREAILVASPEVLGVEAYQGLAPPMSAAQHRGYRLQWLGLALVLVVGWVFASLDRTPRSQDVP